MREGSQEITGRIKDITVKMEFSGSLGRDKDKVGFQDLMDGQEGASGPPSHPLVCSQYGALLEEVGMGLGSGAVSRASEDHAFVNAEGNPYGLSVS